MMRFARSRFPAAAMLLAAASVALSGCGVLQETIDGMNGQGTSATPGISPAVITVTVAITGDGERTGPISIEIDTVGEDEDLSDDAVDLPFEQEFTIPLDEALPLRGTRVEVAAAPGATFVECTILIDGAVVSTHRAEGSDASAICERRLAFGPS